MGQAQAQGHTHQVLMDQSPSNKISTILENQYIRNIISTWNLRMKINNMNIEQLSQMQLHRRTESTDYPSEIDIDNQLIKTILHHFKFDYNDINHINKLLDLLIILDHYSKFFEVYRIIENHIKLINWELIKNILQKSDDAKSILITYYYNPETHPDDFVSFYKLLLDHNNSKVRSNIISRIYRYIDLNMTFNIALKDKSAKVRCAAVSHLQEYNPHSFDTDLLKSYFNNIFYCFINEEDTLTGIRQYYIHLLSGLFGSIDALEYNDKYNFLRKYMDLIVDTLKSNNSNHIHLINATFIYRYLINYCNYPYANKICNNIMLPLLYHKNQEVRNTIGSFYKDIKILPDCYNIYNKIISERDQLFSKNSLIVPDKTDLSNEINDPYLPQCPNCNNVYYMPQSFNSSIIVEQQFRTSGSLMKCLCCNHQGWKFTGPDSSYLGIEYKSHNYIRVTQTFYDSLDRDSENLEKVKQLITEHIDENISNSNSSEELELDTNNILEYLDDINRIIQINDDFIITNYYLPQLLRSFNKEYLICLIDDNNNLTHYKELSKRIEYIYNSDNNQLYTMYNVYKLNDIYYSYKSYKLLKYSGNTKFRVIKNKNHIIENKPVHYLVKYCDTDQHILEDQISTEYDFRKMTTDINILKESFYN